MSQLTTMFSHVFKRRNLDEDKLEDSELRWKFALEGAGDGVWDWNIATDQAVYSTRWKEMLGYAEDDILPTNDEWKRRIHPEDRAMVGDTMQTYLKGTIPSYRVEYRLKCKDDSYKWILGRGMIVKRDPQGYPLRMIGTHTDITTLKEAEHILLRDKENAALIDSIKTDTLTKRTQELALITQRFQTTFEYAPIGVVNFSSDSRIENVNQRFCHFLGYKRDELLGMNLAQLIYSDDQANVFDNINQLLTSEWSNFDIEHRYVRKDGLLIWAHITVKLMSTEDGQPDYFIKIVEDITERKNKDAQLVAAKEHAEQLAKTKTLFLANMSHEIRTPMNAILGFSDLALLEPFPSKAQAYFSKINEASKHLLSILNDILDFSKMEEGATQLKLAPFNLHVIEQHLMLLFTDIIESKNNQLTITFSPDVPNLLIGDALRIQQVLINLLANACKFTQDGSINLTINVLERHAGQARLLFKVTDSGIGMSAEEIAKILTPFTQADESISRRYGGTGLGLSICDRLLNLMGSELRIDSTLDVGSQFYFELCLDVCTDEQIAEESAKTVTTPAPVISDKEALIGSHLLLVEDNVFNQQVIQAFLKLQGITFVTANNGVEALEEIEKADFDLVLMDINMPVMDGYTATREIKQQARYADLPIIALSAAVTPDEQEDCIAAGMIDFIEKPIVPAKLISVLNKYLKK